MRIVSLSRSSAHMPRVTLRTVEPAKLLACQSVENRCTRWKASAAMSAIIFSVRSMIAMKATCRMHDGAAARPTRIENAATAAFQIVDIAGRPTGDGVDQAACIERRQHVGQRRKQHGCHDDGQPPGLAAPVREGEAKNAAERAAAESDTKTSHDCVRRPCGRHPSGNRKDARRNRCRKLWARCEGSLRVRRRVQAARSIRTAEPRETMSIPGMQTSLAWVAKVGLITKGRGLAKPGAGQKIKWAGGRGNTATPRSTSGCADHRRRTRSQMYSLAGKEPASRAQ